MITALSLIWEISPLATLPYTLLILIVISYLANGKYKVKIQLKYVPASTILKIDLSRVKLNLQIENMVYNFLLVMSSMECTGNIFAGINQISKLDLSSISNFTIISCCRIEGISSFETVLGNFSSILLSLLPPMVCLILIVLRRAYLNLPYTKWIRMYTACILFRFLFLIISSLFVKTFFISQMLLFPTAIVDFYIYQSCFRRFYFLLKGRTQEARWHSTQRDYIIKRRIATQFLIAQIYTLFCFLLTLLDFFLLFVLSPLSTTIYSPSLFYSVSFGYFPNIVLSSNAKLLMISIMNSINLTQIIVVSILEISVSLCYILVFIGILWKLIRKYKRYNNINEWVTQPLMEKYRESFQSINHGKRPPFIQAFRSGLIY